MSDPAKLKALWLAVARAEFNPGRRRPCHICGRFAYVAQAHHVVPLAVQFDRHGGFGSPDHEHAWLCPTHHAIVHVLIDGNPSHETLGQRALPILADLDEEQLAKVMDLIARSGAQ